jgi:hypothetical protein
MTPALLGARGHLLGYTFARAGSLWIMMDLNDNIMMSPELMNLHLQH